MFLKRLQKMMFLKIMQLMQPLPSVPSDQLQPLPSDQLPQLGKARPHHNRQPIVRSALLAVVKVILDSVESQINVSLGKDPWRKSRDKFFRGAPMDEELE